MTNFNCIVYLTNTYVLHFIYLKGKKNYLKLRLVASLSLFKKQIVFNLFLHSTREEENEVKEVSTNYFLKENIITYAHAMVPTDI